MFVIIPCLITDASDLLLVWLHVLNINTLTDGELIVLLNISICYIQMILAFIVINVCSICS